MIGTAFSVMVRPCAPFAIESSALRYLVYIMTSSGLGQGESPRLNLACQIKALKSGIYVKDSTRDVVPMVKVILLESNPLVTSREGFVHAYYRYNAVIFGKSLRPEIDYTSRQAIRNGLNVESRKPKGTIVAKRELGDCLSVGTYQTYGNGALVVGKVGKTLLKGGRRFTFNPNSQYNGSRCYSTTGELPRRFEKLVHICENPIPEMKINDIYKLMYNVRMYEVAYHKLRSNPGNMTPGITPTTLDGFSSD